MCTGLVHVCLHGLWQILEKDSEAPSYFQVEPVKPIP